MILLFHYFTHYNDKLFNVYAKTQFENIKVISICYQLIINRKHCLLYQTESSCYLVYDDDTIYRYARELCLEKDAYLASINDGYEQAFVNSLVS